jgi:hypothetical protein
MRSFLEGLALAAYLLASLGALALALVEVAT